MIPDRQGGDQVIELGVVVILGMTAVMAVGADPRAVAYLAVAAVTPALIRHDLVSRRLPNVLVGLAAGGLVTTSVVVATEQGPVAAAMPWAWAGLWFVVGFALAVGGLLGMGDVKLGAVLVGTAAPSGAVAVGTLVAAAGVVGLVAAVGSRAYEALDRRQDRRLASQSAPSEVPDPHRGGRGVPFGPCLLLAFWSVTVGTVVTV